MVRQICLLLIIGALSLSACGSSKEGSTEPQTDQAMLQATIDALQATVDASGPTVSAAQPNTSQTTPTAAITPSTPTSQPEAVSGSIAVDSQQGSQLSLENLIIGSWLSTSQDDIDMLDFLPNGTFFMDSGVEHALAGDVTYQVDGDQIILTDHRYVQNNTFPIVVGEISESSMTLVEDPWSSGPRTFRKLKGSIDLSSEILGLWLFDRVVQEEGEEGYQEADLWCKTMIFLTDGTHTGCYGEEYQVLSNSVFVLLSSTGDEAEAIRVNEIAGEMGSFVFEIWDPPVLFLKHRIDEKLKDALVGVWADGALEFTPGGWLIENAGGQQEAYAYETFEGGFLYLKDGPLFQLKFKSENEMWFCYPRSDDAGALIFDCGREEDIVTRRVSP